MTLELVPRMSTDIEEYHGLTTYQQEELAKPLNERVIKERKGPKDKNTGQYKMLKYITGKNAIETANRIFGIGRWGYRVLSKTREVVGDQQYYTADIELYVAGCPFPVPGEGEGIPLNNTVEQHAKARKEAVTDALKRALRHYGDQFGLCLYDEDDWVEDADGNPVQVKNVHPTAQQNGNGNKSQAARRTVDADPSQAEAPRQTHHTPLVQAMLDAREAGMITGTTKEQRTASWEEQVIMIFGKLISPEEQAKPANIAKINAAIQQQKATSGK